MTKKITLELTLEELRQIDKYVELNSDTQQLFDKIRDAYPKPKTLTERTDTWREIFISLTEDEGRYEMGEVNFYHLASHIEELYVRIAELEARLND